MSQNNSITKQQKDRRGELCSPKEIEKASSCCTRGGGFCEENGCGSKTEKIAVATKQSTGLFLPNSLLSNCPNVAEFGASASSQTPYRSK